MEPTTCGTATWQTPHHKNYNRGGTFPTKRAHQHHKVREPNCKPHQQQIQIYIENLRITTETLGNTQL